MILRLVPVKTNINFLGNWKLWFAVSAFFLLGTLGLSFSGGLNYGIDFAGGTLVQVKTGENVEVAKVRSALKDAGVTGASIQSFDNAQDEYLIRLPSMIGEGDEAEAYAKLVNETLAPVAGGAEVRRVEFVGPQIGDELKEKGVIALLLSLGAILIYIAIRFELRYAIGAIAALFHDVFLTVGVFMLLQKEVSMAVLAALLTVIGYSLNDTIVVYDRVRENIGKHGKKPLQDVLNISVNEMLNRTLMTSLTTLVVLVALYFLGGGVINDFAFTLMFGVIVGTYSSIFIAAPVVLAFDKYYQNLPKKDDSEKKVYSDGAQL